LTAIRAEVAEFFDDPDLWLDSENTYLLGRTPRQAVEAGDAEAVREILQRVTYVGVS
jgi:hypothetical protein